MAACDEDSVPGPAADAAADETRKGVLFALGAYLVWGFSASYFRFTEGIDPAEVLAHRIVWAVPFAALVLVALRRTGDIPRAFSNGRIVATLSLTAALAGTNWGVFIWAVTHGHMLETSLGYYINPLVSVVIGCVLLSERLTRVQMVAVGIAAIAVTLQTVMLGVVPWVAFTLAISFAIYGYIRKTVAIGPAQGFFVESLLLSPLAIAYIVYAESEGTGRFFSEGTVTAMLLGAAVLTATPLMLFAAGARRLKLSTIGLMQYLAPSLVFLSAIFFFGEPLEPARLLTFVLIWMALALFSWSAVRQDRAARRALRESAGSG
ncbi:EamA family transporter RarD [Kaustia mangrovi]|uniref:EamA family transporter RarD n=1 Tax=Kaustia mangrovi TaxID=2593653 RepID=A0A7S8C742_9HYPH|nr:EamA family transporter RarD [Kaustia mangrovi]QPC44404.1 EamA family transporter RarD [Kaustia mangrovi]